MEFEESPDDHYFIPATPGIMPARRSTTPKAYSQNEKRALLQREAIIIANTTYNPSIAFVKEIVYADYLYDFTLMIPTGWQSNTNLMVGFPTNIPNDNGEQCSFLIYYGVSLVFDFNGGWRLFGLKRDIKFNPRLHQGPAEVAYPTNALAMNLSIGTGPIFGQGMKPENGGADSFVGRSVDYFAGLGSWGLDYYEAFNEKMGKTDRSFLNGFDFSYSWGSPISFGTVSTFAIPWIGKSSANIH